MTTETQYPQPAPAPVELTDEQIKQAGESVGVWPSGFGARDIRFARAVIAADLKANHQVVPSMHAMSSALHAALAASPAETPTQEPDAWQERQEVRPGVFGEWYDKPTGWSLTRPQEIDSGGIRYQFRPLYAAPTQAPAVKDERAARSWTALAEPLIDEFLEDYEMAGEDEGGRDACYAPTEGERALIKDAVMGLLQAAWDSTAPKPPVQPTGGANG